MPPDSPPQEADALGELRERTDGLAARVVRLEASVQGIQQGAQAALAELLTQAKSEFAIQRDSLLALQTATQ